MERSAELERKFKELEAVIKNIPKIDKDISDLGELVNQDELGQIITDAFADVFTKELVDRFLVLKGLSKQQLEQLPSLNTNELVKRFLEAKRGSISEQSLTSYRYTLQLFAKHYPTLPLSPEQIEAYLAKYENKQTARDIHGKLGLLYRFMHERRGLPNVMQSVQRPRVKRQRKSGLTLEEARAIVEACRTDRELGLIHLYLGHGLRREEALRLNIGDIGDGQMYVTGKTANEPMPLLPETREILLRLAGGHSPKEPVFLSQMQRRLSHQMVHAIVKSILVRAGIDRDNTSCHALRHTFATLMTEYGLDEISCRRLMRHADSSMTERYVHLNLKPLKRKLEQYSPIRLINDNCQKLDKMLV